MLVNNYCTELFKEFSYKSVDDVAEILHGGCTCQWLILSQHAEQYP